MHVGPLSFILAIACPEVDPLSLPLGTCIQVWTLVLEGNISKRQYADVNVKYTRFCTILPPATRSCEHTARTLQETAWTVSNAVKPPSFVLACNVDAL